MYRTGHKQLPSKKMDLSFSDSNWGTQTTFYTKSVGRVGEKKYYQIIDEARKYCTTHHCCATVPIDVGTTEKDERAQIMVSSNIESEVRLPVVVL